MDIVESRTRKRHRACRGAREVVGREGGLYWIRIGHEPCLRVDTIKNKKKQTNLVR